uniref:Proteasome maturation factor UMP1 n=1 Tax=Lotus japonicus TaxID=34305 RepID=I3SAS2_LOTJA|nr:unknown [Lotus japonicus]
MEEASKTIPHQIGGVHNDLLRFGIHGAAFPLKEELDRQILSRFQRPRGAIPSSMLGLEIVTGSLDHFGFEDCLNDPRESETSLPVDMHHGMEVRLGLSKGPVYPSIV